MDNPRDNHTNLTNLVAKLTLDNHAVLTQPVIEPTLENHTNLTELNVELVLDNHTYFTSPDVELSSYSHTIVINPVIEHTVENQSKMLCMDQIKENMVLLGKIPGFPRWPCLIVNDQELHLQRKPNERGDWLPVKFFYDGELTWLNITDLLPYNEVNIQKILNSGKKNKKLLLALSDSDYQLNLKSENPGYKIVVEVRKPSGIRKRKSSDADNETLNWKKTKKTKNLTNPTVDPTLDNHTMTPSIIKEHIKEDMVMLGVIAGYPKWPCIIINEKDRDLEKKPNDNDDWFPVRFFNDGDVGWLKKKHLFSYNEVNNQKILKANKKNKKLLDAFKDCEYKLKLKSENPEYKIIAEDEKLSGNYKRKKLDSQTLNRRKRKKINSHTNFVNSVVNPTLENQTDLNNAIIVQQRSDNHTNLTNPTDQPTLDNLTNTPYIIKNHPKENTVMLGKLAGFPRWPCIIIDDQNLDLEPKPNDDDWFPVRFFNDGNVAWLKQKDLFDYNEVNNKKILRAHKKNRKLLDSFKDADYKIKLKSENPEYEIVAEEGIISLDSKRTSFNLVNQTLNSRKPSDNHRHLTQPFIEPKFDNHNIYLTNPVVEQTLDNHPNNLTNLNIEATLDIHTNTPCLIPGEKNTNKDLTKPILDNHENVMDLIVERTLDNHTNLMNTVVEPTLDNHSNNLINLHIEPTLNTHTNSPCVILEKKNIDHTKLVVKFPLDYQRNLTNTIVETTLDNHTKLDIQPSLDYQKNTPCLILEENNTNKDLTKLVIEPTLDIHINVTNLVMENKLDNHKNLTNTVVEPTLDNHSNNLTDLHIEPTLDTQTNTPCLILEEESTNRNTDTVVELTHDNRAKKKNVESSLDNQKNTTCLILEEKNTNIDVTKLAIDPTLSNQTDLPNLVCEPIFDSHTNLSKSVVESTLDNHTNNLTDLNIEPALENPTNAPRLIMDLIKENTVMLGKITGFPKWPCIIINDQEPHLESKPNDNDHWFPVKFFYDGKVAWLKRKDLFSYNNVDNQKILKAHKKKKNLLDAFKDANYEIKLKSENPEYKIVADKRKPSFKSDNQTLNCRKTLDNNTALTHLVVEPSFDSHTNLTNPVTEPTLDNNINNLANLSIEPALDNHTNTPALIQLEEKRTNTNTDPTLENNTDLTNVVVDPTIHNHTNLTSLNIDHSLDNHANTSCLMMDHIKEDMVMLGKLAGFPKWPCIIINDQEPLLGNKPNNNDDWFPVKFFNDGNIAWLQRKDLFPYINNQKIIRAYKKNKKLLDAFKDVDHKLKLKTENPEYKIVAEKAEKRKSSGVNGRKFLNTDNQTPTCRNTKKVVNPTLDKHTDLTNAVRQQTLDSHTSVPSIIKDNIEENMLMLGKIAGFPKWPCLVINDQEFDIERKPSDDDDWFPVKFFNDGQYAWLKRQDLLPYNEVSIQKLIKPHRRNKRLLDAVKDADFQLKLKSENPEYRMVVERKKSIATRKTKSFNLDYQTLSGQRKNGNPSKSVSKKTLGTKLIMKDHLKDHTTLTNPGVKPILGFIIGKKCLAKEMEKNLCHAGYSINTFAFSNKENRLEKKINLVGDVKKNPETVLMASDNIFLFMDNGQEAKEFISEHVNNFLLRDKSIINMTDMDPDLSDKLSDLVETNGMRYLQSCISGHKLGASNSTLNFYTSGNKSVFTECLPILKEIGSSAYFLGDSAGLSLKFNLSLQFVKCTNLSVLGESLSVIKSMELPKENFIEVMKNCGLMSDYIDSKMSYMTERHFTDAEETVNDLHNQMELCCKMVNRPFSGSALLELFNKFLPFRGYDASVVSFLDKK